MCFSDTNLKNIHIYTLFVCSLIIPLLKHQNKTSHITVTLLLSIYLGYLGYRRHGNERRTVYIYSKVTGFSEATTICNKAAEFEKTSNDDIAGNGRP